MADMNGDPGQAFQRQRDQLIKDALDALRGVSPDGAQGASKRLHDALGSLSQVAPEAAAADVKTCERLVRAVDAVADERREEHWIDAFAHVKATEGAPVPPGADLPSALRYLEGRAMEDFWQRAEALAQACTDRTTPVGALEERRRAIEELEERLTEVLGTRATTAKTGEAVQALARGLWARGMEQALLYARAHRRWGEAASKMEFVPNRDALLPALRRGREQCRVLLKEWVKAAIKQLGEAKQARPKPTKDDRELMWNLSDAVRECREPEWQTERWVEIDRLSPWTGDTAGQGPAGEHSLLVLMTRARSYETLGDWKEVRDFALQGLKQAETDRLDGRAPADSDVKQFQTLLQTADVHLGFQKKVEERMGEAAASISEANLQSAQHYATQALDLDNQLIGQRAEAANVSVRVLVDTLKQAVDWEKEARESEKQGRFDEAIKKFEDMTAFHALDRLGYPVENVLAPIRARRAWRLVETGLAELAGPPVGRANGQDPIERLEARARVLASVATGLGDLLAQGVEQARKARFNDCIRNFAQARQLCLAQTVAGLSVLQGVEVERALAFVATFKKLEGKGLPDLASDEQAHMKTLRDLEPSLVGLQSEIERERQNGLARLGEGSYGEADRAFKQARGLLRGADPQGQMFRLIDTGERCATLASQAEAYVRNLGGERRTPQQLLDHYLALRGAWSESQEQVKRTLRDSKPFADLLRDLVSRWKQAVESEISTASTALLAGRSSLVNASAQTHKLAGDLGKVEKNAGLDPDKFEPAHYGELSAWYGDLTVRLTGTNRDMDAALAIRRTAEEYLRAHKLRAASRELDKLEDSDIPVGERNKSAGETSEFEDLRGRYKKQWARRVKMWMAGGVAVGAVVLVIGVTWWWNANDAPQAPVSGVRVEDGVVVASFSNLDRRVSRLEVLISRDREGTRKVYQEDLASPGPFNIDMREANLAAGEKYYFQARSFADRGPFSPPHSGWVVAEPAPFAVPMPMPTPTPTPTATPTPTSTPTPTPTATATPVTTLRPTSAPTPTVPVQGRPLPLLLGAPKNEYPNFTLKWEVPEGAKGLQGELCRDKACADSVIRPDPFSGRDWQVLWEERADRLGPAPDGVYWARARADWPEGVGLWSPAEQVDLKPPAGYPFRVIGDTTSDKPFHGYVGIYNIHGQLIENPAKTWKEALASLAGYGYFISVAPLPVAPGQSLPLLDGCKQEHRITAKTLFMVTRDGDKVCLQRVALPTPTAGP